MLKYWPGLIVFVDDPYVPLDNNATERALRGRVIGRKNHYGSRSKRGRSVILLVARDRGDAKHRSCGVSGGMPGLLVYDVRTRV